MRAGIGFDAHPLVAGRKLVLGGIEIPFARGLGGWSDADVLTHAVIDSLLGAAALGDIGRHFPPGDPQYKYVSSLSLLKKAKEKLSRGGWRVVNVDATIVAESPRLREYIDPMREKFSEALGIDAGQVSVKASTANGLGMVVRGEGMMAYSVAMIVGDKQ